MFLDLKPGRDANHRAGGTTPRVPVFRQFLNVIGCGVAIPVYYLTTAHSRFPVTLDIIITIVLTELNRYVIEGRRMSFLGRTEQRTLQEQGSWEADHLENQPATARLECVAAVVGWREDPSLYSRALESYKSSRTCLFLLAGIDGDETQDQDMVTVFGKVCVLHFKGKRGSRGVTDNGIICTGVPRAIGSHSVA